MSAVVSPDLVAVAAQWLATLTWAEQPHPIVPALQEKYGLTVLQACTAIREARMLRTRAA